MTPDVTRVLERIEELFARAPGEKGDASRPAFSYGVEVYEEARKRVRATRRRVERISDGYRVKYGVEGRAARRKS